MDSSGAAPGPGGGTAGGKRGAAARRRWGTVPASREAAQKPTSPALACSTELDLSGGRLREVPQAVRKLTGLTKLDLSSNPLRGLPAWLQELTALTAAPGSDRGAKPKYCDDPDHNPRSAHRERRRREAEAKGQRAEETGGQPVTLGITRAAELVATLGKLTAQHADTSPAP
jgi:hypothetical protein